MIVSLQVPIQQRVRVMFKYQALINKHMDEVCMIRICSLHTESSAVYIYEYVYTYLICIHLPDSVGELALSLSLFFSLSFLSLSLSSPLLQSLLSSLSLPSAF